MKWSPVGVWSFFQTDKWALQYAGILNTDDGGQLPAVCIKTLNVLLGVTLVYTFTFSFILFFYQPANYVKVWTRSWTVDCWVKYCNFPDLWPCVIAVIWTGSCKKRMWSSDWGPPVRRTDFCEQSADEPFNKRVLTVLICGIPRELQYSLTSHSFFLSTS